jgi:hypothetical protein
MPTKKPRKARTPPAVTNSADVRLTNGEKTRIGLLILAIKDGATRSATLTDLDRMLGLWASALANVPHVRLRSDLAAQAKPLATRALTFWRAVQRAPDIVSLANFKGFVDVEVLRCQLSGFETTLKWIREEKARKGGEETAALIG